MVEKFRLSPHCDLDHEDSKLFFGHDIPGHDNAPLYQIWLQKFEGLRSYCLGKLQTDGQTDTHAVTQIYLPFVRGMGEGE